MAEVIKEIWAQNGPLDKVYWVCAFIIAVMAGICIVEYLKKNTKKSLDFIVEANKDGRTAVGKLTCFTIHGVKEPSVYHLEYMYMVNGKTYFVTYEMLYHLPVDERKDKMDADMLLLDITPSPLLFYDKKNPKRVMSKIEVFTSKLGLRKIRTPKHNIWRDTEKVWTEPIDLITYY